MGKLADTLLKPETRPGLVKDCVVMVDEEVSSKGGLSGMAIKAGYAAVRAIKPGIIQESLEGLIDDMVKNLEKFWDEYEANGKKGAFDAFLGTRKGQVADAHGAPQAVVVVVVVVVAADVDGAVTLEDPPHAIGNRATAVRIGIRSA